MRGRGTGVFTRLLRILGTLGLALLLVASAGGAGLWILHALAAFQSYHPSMRVQPRPAGQPTTPLAPQAVLVIVDGLRQDAVADMPTLALLQRQGAAARSLVRTPSFSQPTWTTLVSGAWPELNGAASFNAPENAIQPIAVDHIFAAARRAGLTTALAGSSWWAKMIPEDELDARFFVDNTTAEGDQQTAEAALRFLANFHPSLTVIHFGHVDKAGHDAGAVGVAYREAAAQVDDHLRDILQGLDLSRTVLIVTADHGHVDRGGHGGSDAEVVYVPFVATGEAVVPGDYGTIAQADVAPTISAILGAPLPRASQGIVRFEMLRADLPKRVEVEIDAAQQRRDLANLYMPSIGQGSLSDTAMGDVEVALSSLQVENLESAYSLARIATDRIDQEMADARQQRIQVERGWRLPVAVLAIVLPLVVLILRGRRRGLWLFVAAAVTQVVYTGMYLGQGGRYSISGATGVRESIVGMAQCIALASAAGALIVLWRLIREHEGSVLGVIASSLGYSLLTIYLLGAQVAVAYWLNGFRVTWYLPNLSVAFWQLTSLGQVIAMAAVGIILSVVLILAGLVYQGARTLRRRARPATGR